MASHLSRTLHRNLAPVLAIPLLVTLLTGMVYRVGRSWFAMEKPVGSRVLDVHTGAWMGVPLSLVYTVVVGCGLLFLVVTGFQFLWTGRLAGSGPRRWHRLVAVGVCLPLLVSAVTGMVFHFGEAFHFLDQEAGDLLMMLHQGSWLGTALRPFYVLFVGLGLLIMIVSGWALRRRAH